MSNLIGGKRTTSNRGKNDASYALSGNGAVKRIRTPHPHDVLSGRGGGINSHIGNKTFREYVKERREAYTLAGSKAEKARVANEVIDLIKSLDPPGRFLQRDPNSPSGAGWWIEVDEVRALAKTSQALREGAPQIRAAHKDELDERSKKTKRKKNTTSSANANRATPEPPLQGLHGPLATSTYQLPAVTYPSIPQPTPSSPRQNRSTSTDLALESLKKNVQEAKSLAEQMDSGYQMQDHIVAPLMSSNEFDETYSRPMKKVRMEENSNPITRQYSPAFSPTAETPPLTSMPGDLSVIPPLKLGLISPVRASGNTGSNNNGLIRTHSLALSDLSAGDFSGDDDFVNPFADESDILGNDFPKNYPNGGSRMLRNISSDSQNRIGNSFEGNNVGPSKSENAPIRHRSSLGSMSTRYVDHLAVASPPRRVSESNCFCDCAIPIDKGISCICSELADHLLHRYDGLPFSLKDMI